MNVQMAIKAGAACICAVMTRLFGGFDTVLTVLISLLIIDYVTGVSAAIFLKELSSKAGFAGILKKACILCIVAAAHLVSEVVSMPEMRSMVIGFYIANEGISIIENAGLLGVPMPEKLTEILKQLKKDNI